MSGKQNLEIYVHIPFCQRKCAYCDFLSFPATEDVRISYIDALCQEIDDAHNVYNYRDCIVTTIYFGGGTPSVLYGNQIERILDAIRGAFEVKHDAEITIEVNPGTADSYKLSQFHKAGFNRLSIGMQSANDYELKMLSRIHNYQEFERCYENARKVGFDNINIDVMTALPNQTPDILMNTLRKVTALKPEHISAYSLIIEENTPFYEKYGNIEGPVVGEDMERKLYHMTVDYLAGNGYLQYEISNFAIPGKESRHNSGYWRQVPYLGFGLGASSYFGITRLKNTESLSEYLMTPGYKIEKIELSEKDCMEEFMFLGLRMRKGVFEHDFAEAFSRKIDDVYKDVLAELVRDELIEREGGRIFLTDSGLDYGNYVFSRFLL